MVSKAHTGIFVSSAYTKMTEKMVAARRDAGKIVEESTQIYRTTGKLDDNVNIYGRTRISHNVLQYGTMEGDVWRPEENKKVILKNGLYRLDHGVKLPIAELLDGTGSVGKQAIARAMFGMGKMNNMLGPLDLRYQRDHTNGIMQDWRDIYPPFQLAQFESTVLMAQHITRLAPGFDGLDPIEDYEMGMIYMDRYVQTDLNDFYNLRGHLHFTLDYIGRGRAYAEDVLKYLGQTIQADVSTRDLARSLLKKWHAFVVYIVPTDDIYYRRNEQQMVTEWWGNMFGVGRVVVCPDTRFLAELWTGLIYVTETAKPTRNGFIEFASTIQAKDERASAEELKMVWEWLAPTEQHFGAQTKLPGYAQLPKQGDLFIHYRDPWPIGHPRFEENPSQKNKGNTKAKGAGSKKTEYKDWSKF